MSVVDHFLIVRDCGQVLSFNFSRWQFVCSQLANHRSTVIRNVTTSATERVQTVCGGSAVLIEQHGRERPCYPFLDSATRPLAAERRHEGTSRLVVPEAVVQSFALK